MLSSLEYLLRKHKLKKKEFGMSHLSSEQIKMKWTIIEKKYALRSITNKNLKVPEKPKLKCMALLLKTPKTDEKIAVTSTMHFSYRNAIKVR